ncbi:MAG: hypothetical protein IJ848_00490 [Alphaproteobacteria bacterium]|nr:hypothetical protein [Alphaproteobacteria bacterium]
MSNSYADVNRKNHEFDYSQEWDRYCSNTATLKRFIKFFQVNNEHENNIPPTPIKTGITFQVNPYKGGINEIYTNGEDAVGLVCGSCSVSSTLFPFRHDTFHRSGAAHASPFIGAIPSGRVTPKLMQCVYEGTIGKIVVCLLSFLNDATKTSESRATVVQVQEFSSCYMTFLDMTTYPYLTIFEFAYKVHKLYMSDYDVKRSSASLGHVAYEFDYGNNQGKSS